MKLILKQRNVKMKTLIIFILLSFNLFSQTPNNFTEPYSTSQSKYYDLDEIANYTFDKPFFDDEKFDRDDNYAINIESNLNIMTNGTKIKLSNGKLLTTIRLKVEGSKTLNFTFENFYLSPNTKMYIYTIDRTQVMGPITNINNSSSFNTHIIFSNDVIIEVVSETNVENTVLLKNIAYGIKESEYFSEIINESGEDFDFLSIQTSTCHSDIEGFKSNCHFVGEKSPLDTFKQINCSQFDILNKVKRSLCVVITKDSLDTVWTAKSGVLINTVDESATNYCNSYVLTCSHCISDNPKYFAIRFNWLRKNCEIPSGIPNCNINNQPWIDLINMNEVIDYCDVELVTRENKGGGYEYAFLKINNTLRMKEFYTGWKIYEKKSSYNFTLDSNYLAGALGQNPFQAMLQDADLNQYHADISYSQYLVSGHSGMSMFDKNSYYIGLNNQILQALSMSLLYLNIWDSIPTPRDILDPNDIYATDFDNEDSIVVEGVERYEKSDCLFSTIECNPLLDLSDYITPITGDGCCFRLEYIAALNGFVGGTPYGIRIYRDNETQNTLYYDFGSDIFAGSSTNYYDPMNDNVIEFCMDADDLDNDGGKIVIEFQDANGRIICVKEVEVECLDCCSDDNLQIDL